jgi:hypothetical protein
MATSGTFRIPEKKKLAVTAFIFKVSVPSTRRGHPSLKTGRLRAEDAGDLAARWERAVIDPDPLRSEKPQKSATFPGFRC